jgi:hypothetical protein
MQDAIEDSIGQNSDGGQPSDGEVDYGYWGRMPGWTMSEAAALFLGHDPDRMNPTENRQHEPGSPGWEYKRLRRMLKRACEMDELSSPEVPRVLLEWARSNKIDTPPMLVEKARTGGRVRNWRGRHSAMKKERDELRAERDKLEEELKRVKDEELDTRERATLLKMIFAMAKAKFKFDPAASRSDAVPLICSALEGANLKLSDDVIRNKLDDAARLVRA